MRRFHLPLLCLGVLGFVGAHASAQVVTGQIGFRAEGGGRAAGTVCSGFSCTPSRLTGKPNLQLTFSVRAPKNAPFLVIAGAAPSGCVSFPFFFNSLIVPVTILIPGVVNQPDNVKCTGYKGSFQATIPGNVRKGARLALQALANVKDSNGRSRGAFSSAIDITVL